MDYRIEENKKFNFVMQKHWQFLSKQLFIITTVKQCRLSPSKIAHTATAWYNKAVTDRRLHPWCCDLGSYFKRTSFSCRCTRRDSTCKHDVMNIQLRLVNMYDIRCDMDCGLVGLDYEKIRPLA